MPENKGKYCFTLPSGEEIRLFTLSNSKKTEVLITNYGAIITSFKIKNKDGVVNDIVLGFDRVEDYLSEKYWQQYPWFGAAIGRSANRIKNAACVIDGIAWQFTRNSDNDQLHGGAHGFDKKTWQFKGEGNDPQPWLELMYKSPDGEEGFPGNLDVTIRFELSETDELSYTYKAVTDKATIVNLTHHSYFNLDNGEGTIEEHELKINGSATLDQDDGLVATGSLSPVADTPYDFRQFKPIGEDLQQIDRKLYDKSFVTDQDKNTPVAEVRSLKSGLLLQVFCAEPIVHFYSGKWIPSIKGKNGTLYGPQSGFCLETHKHPNAVNIPHFPGTILRPGEIYQQKTVYKLSY